MRIICPSCAAEYDVPDKRLSGPRMVRCARCGGEWVAGPATEEAAVFEEPSAEEPPLSPADLATDVATEKDPLDPEPSPGPTITAMDRLAIAAKVRQRPLSLRAAWIMTAVFLLASVTAVTVWRREIMQEWPPSGRILAPVDRMISNPVANPRHGAER